MCEAYFKHHRDKQVMCNQVLEKMKRETMSMHACVVVCVCVSEISKRKVLCWNPIVCIHMVPGLKLTLGICVRDIIIL